MSSAGRLGLATRAFFLAAVAGLTLALGTPAALQGIVFLSIVAALAVASERFATLGPGGICGVEAVLVAAVLGLTLPDSALLLPYLTVPTLLAGLEARMRVVIAVAVAEVTSLAGVLALGWAAASTRAAAELAAPWVAASVGAGLMSAGFLQVRGREGRGDEASYESARRLLGQLHTVARRLSSGLDPVSIATQVLEDVHKVLEDTQAAVFIRTERGLSAALAYRGFDARHHLVPEDRLTEECWARLEPTTGIQPAGRSSTRYRTALPLRLGARMVGVVVAEGGAAPDAETIDAVMELLDDHALRLDTALVFDEVRSLATTEERRRLAREIHDGVAQEIASLGYWVDELADTAITEAQRSKLESLRGEITRVVSELRLSIFDLRAEVSPSLGLGSALSDYVRLVGARSDMTVHMTLDEAPTRLRAEVETELLRIAQEAVTNARKHANATHLWVHCRIRPPYAQITIEDNGDGIRGARADSYGMSIMRERASRVHASLKIGPRSEANDVRGTRVEVSVGEEDDQANQSGSVTRT